MPTAPARARRTRCRSLTAGTCGTTSPSTPPRPSPATGPASSRSPQPPTSHSRRRNPVAAPAAESRLEARMRDQHAAVQALYARGMGLRAIARELGADRKTVRRFAHAATGDQAIARAIARPTVLDRYQPHLHRRWAEGCHHAAVLHAEITALGYRGSLRTVYRYLQPLRAGTPPAALTPRR